MSTHTDITELFEALEAERDAHERTRALLYETERRLDEVAHERDDARAHSLDNAGAAAIARERINRVRAHIAERTHGDCDGDNPQWDGGFRAACSQILALLRIGGAA